MFISIFLGYLNNLEPPLFAKPVELFPQTDPSAKNEIRCCGIYNASNKQMLFMASTAVN